MSVSIYYTARREQKLSEAESEAVKRLIDSYGIESQLAEREQTGEGYNWESFCVYDSSDPTEPDVVFEGATKLPDNSKEAMWAGLQHWCSLLTAIRRTLAGATWQVQVDDHEIVWDDELGEYDPAQ